VRARTVCGFLESWDEGADFLRWANVAGPMMYIHWCGGEVVAFKYESSLRFISEAVWIAM
jgi:hypothetical protein